MVKWGLGQSYDRVSYLPKKARGYIDITKPASTVGAGAAFFLGSLFYFYYTNKPELIISNLNDIIFACMTIIFAHAASQSMNQAEDAEMDRQTPHKQNRPIPSGIVSEEEARMLAWFFILFALGRAYLVNPTFGGFTTLMIIFGIFYNLEPIRAKERIISIPWQAVSRGLLSFPAIWAAFGDPWTPTPWILGLFMFWYVLSYQNSADIADKEIDEKYNVKTFIVMFGVKSTGYIAIVGTLMMILIIIISVFYNIISFKLISILAILPLCVIMLYYMIIKSDSVSKSTGNSPAWLLFYLGMILQILFPLLVEIMY